ncbi:ankyrin repeat domain-containing protein [Thermospira aquatica]|uniref:Ankyrin repeat domain-containing protein n=1 Tax=Thermospira aquatica TaxID=2828656 RepID=A0AAX3BBT1_9SPIR|nr:ankyrin repeat domain-containing protein [Thermospira aquatica]URA09700.1 ankyrin repeat domain-containing protein [Thermospira aquatica]
MSRIYLLILIFLVGETLFADANRELLLAISQKNFEAVQNAIETKKASVAYRDVNKRTPLHWAVIAGDLKIVAYLVHKGADLEAREKNGATPLHFAAYSKNLDIVKYLIQKGASINAQDSFGWTPLHYYTYYQFEMGVKYLIYADADLEIKTTKPSMGIPAGFTALDIALKINKQAYIEALSVPQTYQNIANKPLLALNITPQLSLSNILLSQETGNILIRVENTGQGPASSTILEFMNLTNPWIRVQTNLPPQYISINSSSLWTTEISNISPPRDTLVSFLVRARDQESKRTSSWQEVSFWIWSNRPPHLVVAAILFGNTPELRPMMVANLQLVLSNDGFGPLQQGKLHIQDRQGWIIPLSLDISSLPRNTMTNLVVSLETTENVQDGETSLELMIFSPSLTHPLIFSRSLPTRGCLPPIFVFQPLLYKKLNLYISTNLSNTDTGESITEVFTNSIIQSYPMIEMGNIGEQKATNLIIEAQILTQTNTFLYTYNIAQLNLGEKRNLVIPLLRETLTNHTLFLKIRDGATTLMETNLNFNLWPGDTP